MYKAPKVIFDFCKVDCIEGSETGFLVAKRAISTPKAKTVHTMCAFVYTFRAQNVHFQCQNSKGVFGPFGKLLLHYQKTTFSNKKDYHVFILDLGVPLLKTQISSKCYCWSFSALFLNYPFFCFEIPILPRSL